MSYDASELAALGADAKAGAARIGSKASAVVRKAAYDVERGMKTTIIALDAVDTGDMLNSVSTTFEGSGRSGSMTAEVGPTAEYAIWVNGGTSRMPPRPFAEKAFDAVLPGFTQAMGQLGGEIF